MKNTQQYYTQQYHSSRIRIGVTGQKILLLLFAGTTLALTTRPDVAIRVLKQVPEAWRNINRDALRKSISRLRQSGLVCAQKKANGAVSELALTEDGERRAAMYRLSAINIVKPPRWDGLWRVVIFDIPEQRKKGRDALVKKLKDLGFSSVQKSVFAMPYECKNEINFIVEAYNLSSYVKFLVVKEIDGAPHLRRQFGV